MKLDTGWHIVEIKYDHGWHTVVLFASSVVLFHNTFVSLMWTTEIRIRIIMPRPISKLSALIVTV